MNTPSIEFLQGVSETLAHVSLRRDKATGNRIVALMFDKLEAFDIVKSFTKQSGGVLTLIDSEGEISVTPSSFTMKLAGSDGDEVKGIECCFELDREEHWERFMRFMKRYAEANGMEYQDR